MERAINLSHGSLEPNENPLVEALAWILVSLNWSPLLSDVILEIPAQDGYPSEKLKGEDADGVLGDEVVDALQENDLLNGEPRYPFCAMELLSLAEKPKKATKKAHTLLRMMKKLLPLDLPKPSRSSMISYEKGIRSTVDSKQIEPTVPELVGRTVVGMFCPEWPRPQSSLSPTEPREPKTKKQKSSTTEGTPTTPE